MSEIVKAFDDLPVFWKLVLALPGIDGIAWGIYRIARGRIVPGILWIVFGFIIFWVIDIISIILYGNVKFFI